MAPLEDTEVMKLYWLDDLEAVYAVWTGTPRPDAVGDALAAWAVVPPRSAPAPRLGRGPSLAGDEVTARMRSVA